MKTRLNIICIFIFIAIAATISNFFVGDAVKGFKDGWNEAANSKELDYPVILFLKNKEYVYTDSIYDQKSNTYLPVHYGIVSVKTPNPPHRASEVALTIILFLIITIATIVQFIYFIRLINAINRNIIFERANVVKLRTIGIAMLITFFAAAAFTHFLINTPAIGVDIAGYESLNKEIWQFSILIPALGILLAAEIFAIALKLKEEQELTI